MLKEIADLKLESRCALVKKKRERSMLMKLRGGTAAFQVEVGRWRGVKEMREYAKSVRVDRLKVYATGCYSVLPGTISDSICLQHRH